MSAYVMAELMADPTAEPPVGQLAGKIGRLPRDRVVRRDDARLPTAWIDTGARAGRARAGAPWLLPDAEAAAIRPTPGPVLAMLDGAGTDTDANASALAALVEHAEAGGRAYVLCARGWEPGRASSRLCACPKVLMRRVPSVPGTGVMTADGAWLWLGDRRALGGWRLQLDGEQAEALRQIFLWLFWHRAIDEAWTGTERPAFRPAGARPFDVAEPSRTAAVRLVTADPSIDLSASGAMRHRTGGAPPAGPLRRLWLPPSGDHHDRLAELVRGGAEVRWADRGLPEIATDARRGAVLSPGPGERLRVELNGEQAMAAANLLEQPGAWRFEIDVRLGDHARGDTRLVPSGAGAALPVEPEQVIELGSVEAEQLRAVAGQAPAGWPQPGPLALSARYRWIVIPPRLPAGTEEDGLVRRWRELDEAWASRLGKVRAALQDTKKERGRLREAFARLAGAVLGFEGAEGDLRERLERLAQRRPSTDGPRAARERLEELAELEAEAERLGHAQEDAEHEARVADAREQQEAESRERTEAARRALPERRGSLEGARARHTETAAELKVARDALETADGTAKQDLKARRAKLSAEVERLGKDIRRLEQEIASLEQQEAAPFVFKPPPRARRPATSGAGFVPKVRPPDPARQVPDEALPEVGKLRSRKGQRYLVIEAWEELARGEQEAERLKARLVAPEDV